MTPELLAAGAALLAVLAVANLVLLLRQLGEGRTTRQALAVTQRMLEAGQRTEAEAVRGTLGVMERALAARAEESRLEAQLGLAGLSERLAREAGEQRRSIEARLGEAGETVARLTERLARDQGEQRLLIEAKLREMSEQAGQRLGAIQASVNEQLAKSVEAQMTGSFQRVLDQFALVQKAMTDVQAVTAQIGDLKRVFSNVKSRGGWGEAQLRAMLEDMLPHGSWEANRKVRAETDEVVEFVLVMPSRETPKPLLAVDAKFPAEDYDRLLRAAEQGDMEAERAARGALERTFRAEARKIGEKYIAQPTTVDFAVMYLPTDGLYVEAARMPGLIEGLNRDFRVLVMGPTLLPALVRTIQLGAVTLSIERKAGEIHRMLGAVRTEFGKIDGVLAKLEKQAGSVTSTIGQARRRTRAMDRSLRDVESLADDEARAVLQLEELTAEDDAGDPADRDA